MLAEMTFRHAAPLSAATLLLSVAAAPVAATVVPDPVDDFLATYVGPLAGDLDVTSVSAWLNGPDQVTLIGEHAAAIGTTAGSAYVWGVDRGMGTEGLNVGPNPIGAGVTFDAVIVLFANATGFVFDFFATGPVDIDPSAISVAGNTISVTVDETLLPSQGLAFADYGYNLWPRYAPAGVDPANNAQVSDLAPDASTFPASIPLPGALALQLAALGIVAPLWRLRRRPTA